MTHSNSVNWAWKSPSPLPRAVVYMRQQRRSDPLHIVLFWFLPSTYTLADLAKLAMFLFCLYYIVFVSGLCYVLMDLVKLACALPLPVHVGYFF